MWVALALLSAFGSATTSLTLKHVIARSGTVVPTAGYRIVAGCVLAGIVLATQPLPTLTPGFFRLIGIIMLPEITGVLCMAVAFRHGELSRVQPLFGTLPMFVMLSGMVVLGEVPTPSAAFGVVLVAAGLYATGHRRGTPWAEPIRALARDRASWYAMTATIAWTFTTLLHKAGIAEVGPLPWAVALSLGSGVGVVLVSRLPGAARHLGAPQRLAPGARRQILFAGGFFTVQQIGLQLALATAPAAYVTALTATSTVVSTLFGIAVLRERTAPVARVAGAAMVATGAVLIALRG